jgi:hypothetical protein
MFCDRLPFLREYPDLANTVVGWIFITKRIFEIRNNWKAAVSGVLKNRHQFPPVWDRNRFHARERWGDCLPKQRYRKSDADAVAHKLHFTSGPPGWVEWKQISS